MFTFVLCNPYGEVFDTSSLRQELLAFGQDWVKQLAHVVLVSNSSMIGRSIRCFEGLRNTKKIKKEKLLWDILG